MEYLTRPQAESLEQRIIGALSTGSYTRAELCDVLDVSRPVLGRALDALRAQAVVDYLPDPHPHGRGRPVEKLALRPGVVAVLGLDISRSQALAVALDHQGCCVAQVSRNRDAAGQWEEDLASLGESLATEMVHCGLETDYVTAIGVGLPVPVGRGDAYASKVVSLTKRWWNAPVIVDNTIRMAALREARDGAGGGAAEQFYVHLGWGVGGSVIVADHVRDGATGYAGELGHARVPGSDRRCYCGKTGCLETVASIPAVCRAADVDDLDALAEALARGESKARSALRSAAESIACVSAAAVLLMSPSRIVVGGELTHACPRIVDDLQEALTAELIPGVPWDIEVVPAILDDDGRAMGAAIAALTYAKG
ncbi:ROK family transcriptional regulator [Cutibacterium sp. WCA-380-WT-3A]|uniref:ROK family transcriptional regulator n=1 Tax=Cutibacterium porci TaxID=2605781 RepID=A0A7K0J3N0_9ACTN|nr:ROK family transcriptional regulator [Cutibacterium porci]MSS44531.1 ROK family transcriptional regulator [Cutibacterium porci]